MLRPSLLAIGVAAAVVSSLPAAAQPAGKTPQPEVDDVISVTGARRREEAVQEVPIPVSVVDGELITEAGAFNVNRIKELIPSVQLYSSNPRNTGVNIRGLGSPFGLTNDGIEPGVGYYVDGVLYARPAATTLDFIDVERVEVLRGPQGTLFGKNTTAGAILVTTRKPSFTPEYDFELGYGDDDFVQAKGSVSGPLGDKVAGRLSLTSTQRDGMLYNVATQEKVNDLDNIGLRTQLLVTPNERMDVTFVLDYTNQEPNGYAQVFAGAVPTQRSAYRQFETIIADLGYAPPSRDPFDRLIDHNTPWKSGNEMGGASANIDVEVGPGTLTSTTAWRFWNWDPSNDRDYLGLPVGTLSQAPSTHEQVTQEIRWAGDLSDKVSGVFGFFAFDQKLNTDPVHTEQAGAALYRFLWTAPNTPAAATPELFDGYTSEITSELNTVSAALFGQIDWAITDRLHLLPGLRFNYDQKDVDFDRRVVGGPAAPTAGAASAVAQRVSAAGVRSRRRRLQRFGSVDAAVRRDGSDQRLRDLRDELQVRRRQLGRPAARRQQQHGALGGRGQARGREPLRDRLQGEPDAGLDGQPDVLQHGDRGLPDAGDELAVRRRARLSRERREGARARRRVRRQREHRQPIRAARLGRLHGCRVRVVHGRAAAARRHGRAGLRGCVGRPFCRVSPSGPRRSAPSTAGRATSSASPASSSRASTSTTAMTSRRARRRRST